MVKVAWSCFYWFLYNGYYIETYYFNERTHFCFTNASYWVDGEIQQDNHFLIWNVYSNKFNWNSSSRGSKIRARFYITNQKSKSRETALLLSIDWVTLRPSKTFNLWNANEYHRQKPHNSVQDYIYRNTLIILLFKEFFLPFYNYTS